MNTSLFLDYVKKYFSGVVTQVVSAIYPKDEELTYIHDQLLDEKYSVDGTYSSIQGMNKYVAADVVSMDSQIDLKSRPSLKTASGEIVKMGIKYSLNEKQQTDLDTMLATNQNDSNLVPILDAIFDDTKRVIVGIKERMELMFLQGFSTGVMEAIDPSDNKGLSVRIDFGYKTDQKFGVTALWSDATAKPVTDIKRVLDKASENGERPTKMYMDRKSFDNLAKSDEVKGFLTAFLNTSATPYISNQAVRDFFFAELDLEIQVIDRVVRIEDNKGDVIALKPWKEGMVILTHRGRVGSNVYATLAEERRPVNGVDYMKAMAYILVSKFSKNDPLEEFTKAEARVLPVVTQVDRIWQLDTTTIQA